MYRWADVIEYKEVAVFGKKLTVPKDINFFTVDRDGTVCGWRDIPSPASTEWILIPSYEEYHDNCILGTLIMDDHIENWYNLIEEV